MAQQETHAGVVRRVFFSNPESPFMAGILVLEDGQELRFSGKVFARIGDRLEVTGEWGEHPKFGRQFNAATGLVRMNESPDAFVHLLAKDKRFKGLGPARARAVVEATLALSANGRIGEALAEYPEQIAERSGVALEIVENAAKVWSEQSEYFDALAALVNQGWSNAQAGTIVHVLGVNSPTLVKGDPYLLIGKVPRFGFRTVDVVAQKMGIASTDPGRLAAGVAFCLDRLANEGDTWTTRDGLLQESVSELRPDTLDGERRISRTIDDLIKLGVIYVDTSPTGAEVVADARLFSAELEVFDWLIAALQDGDVRPVSMAGPRATAIVSTLNDGQRAALSGFATFRAGVVSGGAGVGKTYTVRAICEVAEENRMRVALCAPTGKAARRLANSTDRKAQTIHRLLDPIMDPQTGSFKFTRNASNPIEADLVVIDEVSMVDVRLMRSLLQALTPRTRLLLIGDHHQIPSVSAGAILRDLLAGRPRYAGAVHILTEIVRQAGQLARNTTALLDGVVARDRIPAWGIQKTERGHEESAASLAAMLVEAVVTAPEPLEPFGRALDLAWDVQVLCPMKKGPLGTYALNVQLQRLRQRLLGNEEPAKVAPDERPKPLPGDRVVWTKNDYELDLFNGTQAVIVQANKNGSLEIFTEDGREVTIPAEKRVNIEVAYALTIHKAQGSEWPFVVLVASSSHWTMHDRNLFYTGASRASESLTILGDTTGIQHFAQERKSAQRQTFGAFLVHGWQPRRGGVAAICAEPVGESLAPADVTE